MTTGSPTTDAGPARVSTWDPDAPEPERVERQVESSPDDRRVGRAGPLDSMAFAHIWQLFGYAILDDAGATAGPVARVWTDPASGRLRYLGLTTGRIRRQTHVIPARDVHIDDHDRSIRVGYLAATIRAAPSHNTDVPLTSDQERKVGTHYDNR